MILYLLKMSVADKMREHVDAKLRNLYIEYFGKLLSEIENSAIAGYKYCSFTFHIKGEPIAAEHRTDKYIVYLHCAESIIEELIDNITTTEYGFNVDKISRDGKYGKIFVAKIDWSKQK